MGADTTDRRNKIAFGLAVATVVIVPGLAKYVLTAVGYGLVGTAVWAIGYGGGALAIWYLWIRPLELTGSAGNRRPDTKDN